MTKKRKNVSRGLLALALILVLAAAALAGLSYAKYRGQVVMTGSVSAENRLAQSFTLQEYVLTRQADGSYRRSGDETTAEAQSYQLLPGLTIPQDPFISVSGKTATPAVLYLELLPTESVSYTLTTDWTPLSGVTGRQGGTVYVYGSGAALREQSAALEHISILKDGFHAEQSVSGSVQMVGYLLQTGSGYTASQAAALYQERLNGN